ncbi:MAG: hypothetical protein CBC83_01355 [Flavobacteriales bacterium TMED123]|nr:MAG: hypothetical protein CBC83_01355 [Flavobacteriales bacterium TMED123]|tara:strand:+ start:4177 stop:4782 length:606 start_codon:yes stop_codon:yes gene_type:complete
MENYDNEQRLRILQERLGQIKSKQEGEREQPKVENTPPYPTYNPKATQSSDEDVVPEQIETEKKSSSSAWKKIITLFLIGGLAYSGYYFYENFDFSSLTLETTNTKEPVVEENIVAALQYTLDFGEAKHLILLSSFDNEDAARMFADEKANSGYDASYFFLPAVSNSNKTTYQVYLGPYFSESEAKQWANTLEIESEILNL